jgi:broad specificity phosphatase PhoE
VTPAADWPASLLLVRHAESVGNVARAAADEAGAATIDITERDMDVDLSRRGEQQAAALGGWLGRLEQPPAVALTSPYLRTRRTAELALGAGGLDGLELCGDERLREREFGSFDRLTRRGLTERFPEEWEARVRLGKFYHRPPGGESWCDVALRVRSLLDSIGREYGGERLVVFTHEVVLLMFRYVLERSDGGAGCASSSTTSRRRWRKRGSPLPVSVMPPSPRAEVVVTPAVLVVGQRPASQADPPTTRATRRGRRRRIG